MAKLHSPLKGIFVETEVQQNFHSKLCYGDTQCKKLKRCVEKEILLEKPSRNCAFVIKGMPGDNMDTFWNGRVICVAFLHHSRVIAETASLKVACQTNDISKWRSSLGLFIRAFVYSDCRLIDWISLKISLQSIAISSRDRATGILIQIAFLRRRYRNFSTPSSTQTFRDCSCAACFNSGANNIWMNYRFKRFQYLRSNVILQLTLLGR